MKYMLLMHAAGAKVPQTTESIRAACPAGSALSEELEAAGVVASSCGLSPIGDAAAGNGAG